MIVDRRDLWPDPVGAAGEPDNDLVTLYESRLDIPNRLWTDLIAVPGDVEILATDLRWFLETRTALTALVPRKARDRSGRPAHPGLP